METRTIVIANTKTQRRYNLETTASTLGELMDEMSAQGIDYSGMSFTEGISKTQLLTRESLLPTNVMYKGAPTNNLVMLLTNTQKNIASGAMDRKEAYSLIKEMGLQEAIQRMFGENYTRIKTAELERFIINFEDENPEEEEDTNHCGCDAECECNSAAPNIEFINIIYDALKQCVKDELLYAEDLEVLADLLDELAARTKEVRNEITDEDINNMLNSL